MKTIILCMAMAVFILSCRQPEPQPEPVDLRAYNDSIIKAVNDSLDSLGEPVNTIDTQMRAKAVFDSIKQ